jgi:2-polyprenyl-3-methyl-5-hydroxy-6-metoxy-1,4-benzoquinol methylase
MPDLSKRSKQLELLDMPVKDKEDLRQNLKEISFINKVLGGDQVTFKGLKKLMIDRQKRYSIVDIGCGDGGLLRRIWRWSFKQGFKVEITGIDINPDAIAYAKEKSLEYPGLAFINQGYEAYFEELNQKPDIIISALFCHHLNDELLQDFLMKMIENSQIGYIVNDLHRNHLAFFSIKWLTIIFSRSRLTKHDAPVSVLRGFKKEELKRYFQLLPSIEHDITWQWAFRYLIVARKMSQ